VLKKYGLCGNENTQVVLMNINKTLPSYLTRTYIEQKNSAFAQQGNIEQVLKKYGLCGNENTQVVPYFSIYAKGSRAQDCRVDLGKDAMVCV